MRGRGEISFGDSSEFPIAELSLVWLCMCGVCVCVSMCGVCVCVCECVSGKRNS